MSNLYLNVNELVAQVTELSKAAAELEHVKEQLIEAQRSLEMYQTKELADKIQRDQDLEDMAREHVNGELSQALEELEKVAV